MARKLTDTAHLKLRFDEKLRRRVEREAARNDRPMNAEIADRLEKSFETEVQWSLMVQAATAALSQAGMRVVSFGAPAEEPSGQSPQQHQVNHPVHLRLRFSEALRRRLEGAADKNGRAMTAEIIDRLEKSFQKQEDQQEQKDGPSQHLNPL